MSRSTAIRHLLAGAERAAPAAPGDTGDVTFRAPHVVLSEAGSDEAAGSRTAVILDGGKQAETEYALRLYSLHELGQLLNSAGFRVTEVSGREALPGVFFGQESPQMIIVAERRGVSDATGQYKTLGD